MRVLVVLMCFMMVVMASAAIAEPTPVDSLKQIGNSVLVNMILAVVSAVGAAVTALITYGFAFMRRKWKILELTKIDESIESKLLGVWSTVRQHTFKGFKRQAGPGKKITWDQSKECMDESIQLLYSALSPEELKKLGVQTWQEFYVWAKTQFENVTDLAKGRLNFDVGKSAKLAIGKVETPIIGSKLVGLKISTKW